MDSYIKYMGGKSLLRNEIISMIPTHKTYVEVFCGASWVLFSKPPSHVEIINDIDNNIVNLYLVVKNQLDRFLDWLKLIPISETLFSYFADQEGIPPLEEGYTKKVPQGIPEAGAKFYYVLMNSFNGKISDKPAFTTDINKRSPFVRFYNTDWENIRMRLKDVTILNRDFREIIKKYDSPETLFYLDPPYMIATNNKRYYKNTFTEKDHKDLLVYLKDLEGKFILSYGNDKKIIKMYKDFKIKTSSKYQNELLITNFEIPEKGFFCRDGIPSAPGGIPRASWYTQNCPYCNSREVQQVSKRVTMNGGKRNWIPCGYTCRNCKNLFRRSP